MADTRNVAIVPARGGSKRLPRKNVLPILGRPLLAYPISAALRCRLFDQVLVSTEDGEIAEAARSAGAQVIERPKELAEDTATVANVCLHILEALKHENVLPEYFCCIYPTAVFLTPKDLLESFRILQGEHGAEFVMGVSEYNLQPVQALVEKDGYLSPMWPEYHGIQSQFQPQLLASNGTLYWARVSAFLRTKSFYGKRLKGYVVPKIRAIDIDTKEDFRITEILAPHIVSSFQG